MLETVEIKGRFFQAIVLDSFEVYLQKLGKENFFKLSPKEKETLILRWAYGTKDDTGNRDTWYTDCYLLGQIFKTDENFTEYQRKYWKMEAEIHERILSLKKRFGIN